MTMQSRPSHPFDLPAATVDDLDLFAEELSDQSLSQVTGGLISTICVGTIACVVATLSSQSNSMATTGCGGC
jgi:hypothetical protein